LIHYLLHGIPANSTQELIKYKGIQVAPAELEALLISHPDIADAAVIGVEAEGTEVPRAYVVADQKKMSAEKIASYVKENVASYKQLRGGVIFLDVIPKSPSGKVGKFSTPLHM
jgi:4-coumarate--CoA ligase